MTATTRTGACTWYIPDGYLPDRSVPVNGQVSHEAVCLLNVTDQAAQVTLTFYFEKRQPIRNVNITLEPERTWHVRLDKPEQLGGIEIPQDTPYALRVESDVPIIVQHSRMDVHQPSFALFTTMGWPGD